MPLRCAKDDMQSIGSAITYARRYTLQSLVCCQTDEPDDDGNSAVGDEKMKEKVGKRSNYKKPAAKSQGEAVNKQADELFVKP